MLAGVLAIAFGAVLALLPGVGALAMVLWIGAWSIVMGVLNIALGFQVRALERGSYGPHTTPKLQPSG